MTFATVEGKMMAFILFLIGLAISFTLARRTSKVNREYFEQIRTNLSKPETRTQTEKMLSDRRKRAVIWLMIALAVGLFLPFYVIDGFRLSLTTLVITLTLFVILAFCVLFIAGGIKNIGEESSKKGAPKSRYLIIRQVYLTLFALMWVVILLEVLNRPSFPFEAWIIGLFLIFGSIDTILVYKGYLNIFWNPLGWPGDMIKRTGLLQAIMFIFVGLFFLFLAVVDTLRGLSVI